MGSTGRAAPPSVAAPRLAAWRRWILTVAGFAAGAVFGVVIEDILNTDWRLVVGVVAILCLTILGLTLLAGELGQVSRASHADLLERLADMDRLTRTSLDSFGRNFNLRVRSQMLKDTNAYHSPDQDLVVKAFRRAKREILVLDHLTDEGVRPDVDMRPSVMKWHLDAIMDKAQEGVAYRRFCQVTDTARPFHNIQVLRSSGREDESVFASHCVAMCEMRSAASDVILKVAPKIYPYKFLIIDRSVLVLQLHETVQGDGEADDDPRTLCELVIDDPQRQLIDHLLSMWHKVDNHPKTRAITAGDPEIRSLKGIDSQPLSGSSASPG